MFDGLCNFFDEGYGKLGFAIATAVGGLHMMATEGQPVLGVVDSPKLGWFDTQHTLGLVLTVGGLCCVRNCMRGE